VAGHDLVDDLIRRTTSALAAPIEPGRAIVREKFGECFSVVRCH
jgi:hypothetical protein